MGWSRNRPLSSMKNILLVLGASVIAILATICIVVIVFSTMNHYSAKAQCQEKGGVLTNDGYCISKSVIIEIK